MADTVSRVAEIKAKISKGYCERENSRGWALGRYQSNIHVILDKLL